MPGERSPSSPSSPPSLPSSRGRGPGRFGGPALGGLRIGLLGGSFNPAHDGHRFISQRAMAALGLDAVWWLVSPQNPLKPRDGMAPLADRLARARHLARHPRIRVTDLEQSLGTRYTVDTAAAIQTCYPKVRFVWIIGADNFCQLPQWTRWTALMQRIPVAIVTRHPYSLRAGLCQAAMRFSRARLPEATARTLPDRDPPAWVLLHGPAHPASATALRSRGQGLVT